MPIYVKNIFDLDRGNLGDFKLTRHISRNKGDNFKIYINKTKPKIRKEVIMPIPSSDWDKFKIIIDAFEQALDILQPAFISQSYSYGSLSRYVSPLLFRAYAPNSSGFDQVYTSFSLKVPVDNTIFDSYDMEDYQRALPYLRFAAVLPRNLSELNVVEELQFSTAMPCCSNFSTFFNYFPSGSFVLWFNYSANTDKYIYPANSTNAGLFFLSNIYIDLL